MQANVPLRQPTAAMGRWWEYHAGSLAKRVLHLSVQTSPCSLWPLNLLIYIDGHSWESEKWNSCNFYQLHFATGQRGQWERQMRPREREREEREGLLFILTWPKCPTVRHVNGKWYAVPAFMHATRVLKWTKTCTHTRTNTHTYTHTHT